MPMRTIADTVIIVLNWNGAEIIKACVDSLLSQQAVFDIIVVDNNSGDNSREIIEQYGDKITSIYNDSNRGFSGGVNTGIRYALEKNYEYIGLLNNDAVAKLGWVKHLRDAFSDETIGSATSTMIHSRDQTYDSTGDFYTIWGMAYPRGRDKKMQGQYDKDASIMTASGGASMFLAEMFRDIGLFDEDFFAYYEDVDLGLRAITRGWRAVFAPKASVLHATGSSSNKIKNFGAYQAVKNQPMLLLKNIPSPLFWRVLPRFVVSYGAFSFYLIRKGNVLTLLKGWLAVLALTPRKLKERRKIMKRAAPDGLALLESLIIKDVPPNIRSLKKLQEFIRKIYPDFN